jgi:hypothetical protein
VGALAGDRGRFPAIAALLPLVGTWAFAVWVLVPALGLRLLQRTGVIVAE